MCFFLVKLAFCLLLFFWLRFPLSPFMIPFWFIHTHAFSVSRITSYPCLSSRVLCISLARSVFLGPGSTHVLVSSLKEERKYIYILNFLTFDFWLLISLNFEVGEVGEVVKLNKWMNIYYCICIGFGLCLCVCVSEGDWMCVWLELSCVEGEGEKMRKWESEKDVGRLGKRVCVHVCDLCVCGGMWNVECGVGDVDCGMRGGMWGWRGIPSGLVCDFLVIVICYLLFTKMWDVGCGMWDVHHRRRKKEGRWMDTSCRVALQCWLSPLVWSSVVVQAYGPAKHAEAAHLGPCAVFGLRSTYCTS